MRLLLRRRLLDMLLLLLLLLQLVHLLQLLPPLLHGRGGPGGRAGPGQLGASRLVQEVLDRRRLGLRQGRERGRGQCWLLRLLEVLQLLQLHRGGGGVRRHSRVDERGRRR